jgi:hypothetical protein
MGGANTPDGACGMPPKQPQQSGAKVLPAQPSTGTTSPTFPTISPAQQPPPTPGKADYQ